MRIEGSNRLFMRPRDRKTLAWMAGIAPLVIDVDEESTGASSPSVEMISDASSKGEEAVDSGSSSVWTDNLIQFLEKERWGGDAEAYQGPRQEDGVVVIEDDSEDELSEAMEVDEVEEDAMEVDDEVEFVSERSWMETKSVEEKLDEVLGTLNVGKVKELIESACSRLKSSLDSLKLMAQQGHASVIDAEFVGFQTAHHASNSGNLTKIEEDKDLLLGLLFQIKKQCPGLFTAEQMREMDNMMQSVPSGGVDIDKDKEVNSARECIVNGTATLDEETLSSNSLEPRAVNSVGLSNGDSGVASIGQPCISLERASTYSQTIISKDVETENSVLLPYAMDALKNVSSYQQRFGQTSLLSSNRLPSPTPSGECNGDDDPHGEPSSSSSIERDIGTQELVSPYQDVGPRRDLSSASKHQGASGKAMGTKKKVPYKDRDPRLKIFNSEVAKAPKYGIVGRSRNIKKHKAAGFQRSRNINMHKAVVKSELDDHALKAQRNGYADTSPVASRPNESVQLNKNMILNIRKPGNGDVISGKRDANTNSNRLTDGTEQMPGKSAACNVILPSLLEGIARDPPMLVHLIEMRQERIAAEAQKKAAESGKELIEKSQLVGQTALMNSYDAGMIPMKPCEPRHILFNNIVQKSEGMGLEQSKPNGTLSLDTQSSKELVTIGEHGERAQMTSSTVHSMSNSTLSHTPPAVPQSISKPMPNVTENVNAVLTARDCNSSCEGSTEDCSPSLNPWGDVDHLLDGFDDQEKAAIQRERARRIEEQNKMFSARKLCLVLDLDHTLLNSVKFEEVDPVHDEMLRKREEQDRDKPQRHLFCFPHMGMWTKLRPGIWNFLEKASKLYELHIYTMGNKLYATEMAKVLDPKGVLFAGRVIARGDDADCLDGDERVPKSKDLDGVLGMESAVVIIDDTARVWPHHRANLITVERYTYFPCSRRQFGLPGPALLEIDRDERAADGTLASSLAVIERMHGDFFSHHSLCEADVRKILASERRKVLAGCRIVFSRVFPVGEANPHLHPLWQIAEQFGAICTNQVDEQVTHVVATSPGTAKVNWARSTKRFIVRPSWVEASAFLYRRANELHFAVKLK